MLTAALGLEPDALNHRLVIRDPQLPALLNEVTLHDIHVGAVSLDLRFERIKHAVKASVIAADGDLEVVVE
jgi:hypothetical protein